MRVGEFIGLFVSIYNRTKLGRACVSRRIERLLNECWRRRRRRLGSSKRAPGAPRRLLERRSLGLGAPESLLAAPRAVAVVPNWCDIVLFLIKSRQRQRGGRRARHRRRRGAGRQRRQQRRRRHRVDLRSGRGGPRSTGARWWIGVWVHYYRCFRSRIGRHMLNGLKLRPSSRVRSTGQHCWPSFACMRPCGQVGERPVP